MPDWWICQVSSGHEFNLRWAGTAVRGVGPCGVHGPPGMNRPGACRVAAIELTRGPDKPGNSRVEVVDSGRRDFHEGGHRRSASWGGGEAPA